MTIHRLIQKDEFNPEEIKVLVSAFEDACRSTNATSATRNIVAAKIIDCAQRGERNYARLRDFAAQDHALASELALFASSVKRTPRRRTTTA